MLVIPPEPCRIGEARRFVQGVIGPHLSLEPSHDASLVVSELVTNAVLHAGTVVTVTVECLDEGRVRIGVSDGSSAVPVVRSSAPHEPGGRGLHLVDLLSDRWGVTLRPIGKQVWCEIAAGAA
jgi:anti-sigma regulatory factor (Ser/Thr protein kinase)